MVSLLKQRLLSESIDSLLDVCAVSFEMGSKLCVLSDGAFRESGLKSIVILSSVVSLGKESLALCDFLECVMSESGSRL
jgi:hypothetical protein